MKLYTLDRIVFQNLLIVTRIALKGYSNGHRAMDHQHGVEVSHLIVLLQSALAVGNLR